MTDDRARRASDLLWNAWREGRVLDGLPAGLRPTDADEGFAIQAGLEARSAHPLYGWKIAATSVAGQQHIGVTGPLAGRLLAEQVFADGDTVPSGANRMAVAEPEFAFRLGADLPPRDRPYTEAEVLAAVASLHPAIEIPDSRYADFARAGEAQLIADAACAHQFVLGAAAPAGWRDLDLAAQVVQASVTGRRRRYRRDGIGSAVLGDPRIALVWIANELPRRGLGLRVGQVVTTGACVKPLEMEPGDRVEADFGPVGRIAVSFGDAR